jgi:6-phosphogluconolactonase
LVYFGTYTKQSSKGIYVSKFNSTTGQLSAPVLAAKIKNPSFVAIHKNKKFLFAVIESEGAEAAVCSFSIAKDGKLTKISEQPTKGDHPCHVSLDKTGKTLFIVNYTGGNIASYPLGSDGKIGAGKYYQHKWKTAPHPHSIHVDAKNNFVIVADKGMDQIIIYKLDKTSGKLTPSSSIKLPDGGGPRHFAFHPNGKFAYANLENSRHAVAMSYDSKTGSLKQLQVLTTLPEGAAAKGSTAECLVHPNGKWLYVSNRGHNSIAVFSINQTTGKLTMVEVESTKGEIPRGFGIDPSGKYIIAGHQNSDHITVLRINQYNGSLTSLAKGQTANEVVNVRFLKK